MNLIEQYALYHSKNIEEVMDQLCHFLPLELETICIEWIQTFGEEIIELIEKEENPDQVCLHLSFCDNPSCSLFGSASSQFIGKYKNKSNQKETPWDWIMERLNQVTKNHLPFIDFDNDKYSTISTLRGANWRGRDCDDGKLEIHPGAKYGDPSVDYNCNGIYGFVPNSKTSYEDLFCKNSQPIGVAILGGSACSHFEIDPKWSLFFFWFSLNPKKDSSKIRKRKHLSKSVTSYRE